MPQIMPLFPKDIRIFVDLFCGGCNVGINVKSDEVIYNDLEANLIFMYNAFKQLDKDVVFEWIYGIIEEYGLSDVSKFGYEYYKCDSARGLGDYNRDGYMKLREKFNFRTVTSNYDYHYYIMLYVIIVYAFNNQIRFNNKGEFNLPVGKRDFNQRMQVKLSDFIDRIKEQNNQFISLDFRKFDTQQLCGNDLVYADPPYLITCATYNEQGGWGERLERDLLGFLDSLNDNGIRFALSNVLRSKGKENSILIEWLDNNTDKYNVERLNYSYANSNYHTKDRASNSEEVLIRNYK